MLSMLLVERRGASLLKTSMWQSDASYPITYIASPDEDVPDLISLVL